MYIEDSINLLNLLLSLSDALDLASPYLAQHQMRTAFIAWEIAKESDISDDDMENLFIASLLHDVGALTPEEKLNIHKFEIVDPEPHCIYGEAFLEHVPFFKRSSQFVRFHHTPWSQLEKPKTDAVAICSQILHLADTVERAVARPKYILHQVERIINFIDSQDGEFCPDVIAIFKKIARREDFWLDSTSPRLYSTLLHHGPGKWKEINLSELLLISELFRNLIDFRSRFTATHTTGVAASAASLAKKFGLTDTEVELMEVAGNFHDLGKLIIPNSILEKPDKLTEDEFALMKQHTYFTYTILTTIGGIKNIAEWAAFHHERLDGSGYPFHLDASKLTTGARIMAIADILTALAEDRPYRKGMENNEILDILLDMGTKGFLDLSIIKVLKNNLDEIIATTREKQKQTLHTYNEHFTHY